jgi:H+/gluconate symporter-like permease
MSAYIVELLGVLIALGLLIFLAFRGYTLLLAAPVAAIVAAAFSGEPILATNSAVRWSPVTDFSQQT